MNQSLPSSIEWPSAPPSSGWWRLVPLLLALAAVAAYANSFRGAFVLDDEPHIVLNPLIRQFSSNLFSGRRAIVNLSLAWDYHLATSLTGQGLDLRVYHATNLAIHLFAGLLLWGILRRTLDLPDMPPWMRTRARPLALIIALLWLVHPLQTQAVTYIIQRSESLCGLFYLLGFYALLRAHQSSSAWPRRIWQVLVLLACVLGLATKEVMAGAPLLILLFDRAFLAGSWSKALRARPMLYAGLGLIYALGLLALALAWAAPQLRIPGLPNFSDLFAGGSAAASAGWAYKHSRWWEYPASQPQVILHYLRLAFWPHPLVMDYFDWPLARNHQVWELLWPALLILGALAATLWALWRRPRLGFMGAAFFVILAPSSSIIPIADLAMEHRMYLPLAVVLILTVLGAWRLLQAAGSTSDHPAFLPRLASVLVGVVAVALTLGTLRRNQDYISAESIYRADSIHRPKNPRPYRNLASALMRAGRPQEAIAPLTHFTRMVPIDEEAQKVLANLYLEMGKPDQALPHLQTVLRQYPRDAEAGLLLGKTLEALGQKPAAATALRQVLALAPGHPAQMLLRTEAGTLLGRILLDAGQLEAAEAALRDALGANPRAAEIHALLGLLLVARGQYDLAIQESSAAWQLDQSPSHARQLAWLIVTLPDTQLGSQPLAILDAVQLAQQANQATGERNPFYLDTLAAAYARSRRYAEAVATAQKALALAQAAGETETARLIRVRLTLYQNQKPYAMAQPSLPASTSTPSSQPASMP